MQLRTLLFAVLPSRALVMGMALPTGSEAEDPREAGRELLARSP